MSEPAVTRYFSSWRTLELGARRIIEGQVASAHAAPSAELARALGDWQGLHYWHNTPEGRWLILVQEPVAPRQRWWLHVLLGVIALATMTLGGAVLAGAPGGFATRPTAATLVLGLQFSLPLLAILLAHESGHYLAARRYGVDASPPYFLPFPPQVSPLGTLGAIIRIRSVIFDRRTLFDIGVAGPLAGLAVAIPVLLLGLQRSYPVPAVSATIWSHQFVVIDQLPVLLGDSLLLHAARQLIGAPGLLQLSPMAVAGWTGLLVTMLNLLPLAQLDGGHVSYAMYGRAQTWLAVALWVALVGLGWLWSGWWLWAGLGIVLGRGRLSHPPLPAPERPLDSRRRLVGALMLVLFVLTFMPVPIAIP